MEKMFEYLYTPRCIVRLNSTSRNKNEMKRFQKNPTFQTILNWIQDTMT